MLEQIDTYMDRFTQKYVDGFMADLTAKNPNEKEFHQAVREVLESVAPYMMEHPYLIDQKILERKEFLWLPRRKG